MKHSSKHKIPAYNLQDTLIALAIVGIIMLLALPSYMTYITKTKSIEAQAQLKHLYNMQTLYSYTNSKFSNDFYDIDFQAPKTVKDGGTANYEYTIVSATSGSFKARATAITDFDRDGVFNIWEIDENGKPKQIVKD